MRMAYLKILLFAALIAAGAVFGADTTYLAGPTGGTYTYPDANPIVLGSGDAFWFQGDSDEVYKLTNDFTVDGGEINWSGGSASRVVFQGDVDVTGNRLNLSYGTHSPGRHADFTGTITLSQDTTIWSEPASNAGFPTLLGGVSGTSHTMNVRSKHAGRTMRVGGIGSQFDVGDVDIADSDLRVQAAAASDDYFSQLNTNGGAIRVEGNLVLERGTFDLDRDVNPQGGSVRLVPTSSGAVVLQTTGTPGVTLGSGHAVSSLNVPEGILGPITGVDGATISHTTSWPNNLTLTNSLAFENGSTWRLNHGNLTHLRFDAGEGLRLGDGDSTSHETITVQVNRTSSNNNGPQLIEPHTLTDDGNVALTYKSLSDKALLGWDTDPGDSLSMDTFREGSAGTIFDTADATFWAIGTDTSRTNSFVATNSVRVTGPNGVNFYLPKSTNQGTVNAERRTELGGVVIDADGELIIENTAATIQASQVTVNDGGRLGGIGKVSAPVVVNGTVAPGTSTGTLELQEANFGTGSTLAMEFVADDDHDVLSLTNSVAFSSNAILDFQLVDGYVPETGTSFDILNWNTGFTGDVESLAISTNLPSGLYWNLDSFNTSGEITALPEPSGALLLVLGAMLLLCKKRRS